MDLPPSLAPLLDAELDVIKSTVSSLPESERVQSLLDIALALSNRFLHAHAIADMYRAASIFETSLHLMPENHSKSEKYRLAFGYMLLGRHHQTHSVPDLNLAIEIFEKSLARMPESQDEQDVERRRKRIKLLETLYQNRAVCLGSVEDLEHARDLHKVRTFSSRQK